MLEREHIRPDRRPGAHVRTVWDAVAGREWRVWASDCQDVPGARSTQCLIFDCGTTVRRLWAPPDDWTVLPDAALLALVDARRDR